MNSISYANGARIRGAVAKISSENFSVGEVEHTKPVTSPQVASRPHYRVLDKRGPEGQTIFVQGAPLGPVASPAKMAQLARDHARDEWRRQFSFPPGHRERTPTQHREALAALDAIDAAPKKDRDILVALTLDLLGGGAR